MRLDHLLSKESKLCVLFNFEGSMNLQNTNRRNSIHLDGGIAQLVEHLPCKQGVRSSTLLTSTTRAYNVLKKMNLENLIKKK